MESLRVLTPFSVTDIKMAGEPGRTAPDGFLGSYRELDARRLADKPCRDDDALPG